MGKTGQKTVGFSGFYVENSPFPCHFMAIKGQFR